jgi:hypothetical protein
MNTKKNASIAAIFVAVAIIFVASSPLTNLALAKKHDAQDISGSTNYENFLNCLSDASASNSAPAGDQIVNCFVQSGYVQGSSAISNSDNGGDTNNNADVSVMGDSNNNDNSGDSNNNDNSGDSNNNDNSGDSNNNDNSGDSNNNDNSGDSNNNN